MSAAQNALMAAITQAMREKAAAAAQAPAMLVSIAFDVLDETAFADAAPHVEIVRATKTLVFSTCEAATADGRRAIAATAVHRIERA